jgi:REP element-mobilizing transposase RayT
MKSHHPPLEHGHFYHIYNRGINSCKLFRETTNYEHFLGLYNKYISSVADTYAWVLMGNHFHLLVQIKKEDEIGIYESLNADRSNDSVRFQTTTNLSESEGPDKVKKPTVHRHFSHLFNAYTKYFNPKYNRTGKLFETPFSRIKITSEAHLKFLVYYIHHNPIHHGFCEHYLDYPWSSYLTILSPKKTHLKRDEVLQWYREADCFKQYHSKQSIEKFLELQIDKPY